MLDIEVLVEQPPPENDGFASELGRHLVDHALDRQSRITADQAPLRLACEGAETLPGAHLPQALLREVPKPVL